MRYKYYFTDNKKISVLGFGGWQLGNLTNWEGTTVEQGVALVKEALSMGVTFFDTAPNYGNGNSETIMGKALKDDRDKVFINTKVGHGLDGVWEFTPDGIKNSIASSLKRL